MLMHVKVIVIILLWDFGERILVFFYYLSWSWPPPERCELEVIDTQPFIYVHIAFFAKYLVFWCQELPSKFNAVFFSEPGRIPKDEAESRQSR